MVVDTAGGLTRAEAAARLARDGPNQVVPETSGSRILAFLRPLADPMVLLLLFAAPVYFAIGDRTDAIVVLVALVPIAAVGWVLESRAERALAQLRLLTAPTALVVRDGEQIPIPASDLVVDDVMWLHEGDVVPADARVVELTELHVDESSLTGESLPISKDVGAEVYAGTTVLSGRAAACVYATGARTRYGTIGTLVAGTRPHRTPLQRAIDHFVRVLLLAAIVACLVVVAAERLHGSGWGDSIIAGVSLAIVALPEEFPIVFTLYLALGARRLARDRALVRRLPSVETLGATTVICVDKTGTLTEGRLAVGEVVGDDDQRVLEYAVLASEPQPFDPLDVAIVEHARARGVDVDALHASALVVDYPFDPVGKYVTHVWRLPDGTHRVAAKGSAETLGGDSTIAAHDRLAAAGLRVIAVAGGELPATPTGDRPVDERPLGPIGLVAFSDPVREGVEDALAQCRSAGIRVVMITGDHPATAHAVAEGLDLPHEHDGRDLIVTGEQLDAATDDDLTTLVERANVFARTRPEQKHLLVHAFRGQGEIVAMTGDGINDAPALRESDIGVAMGERGTEVARESAAMVLLDDNFATIVSAVRDGRRIFDSLKRAFDFLIAFHPPVLIVAIVAPLLNRPLLLLPIEMVMVELLLHPMVSLVFETDPPDADLMSRPPRDPGRGFVGRRLLRPFAQGMVLGVVVLVAYLIALEHLPTSEARAFAFMVLLLGELLLLLLVRGARRPMTPILGGVIAASLIFTVACVAFEPLADLLKLSAFPAGLWPLAVVLALASTLWALFLPRSER